MLYRLFLPRLDGMTSPTAGQAREPLTRIRFSDVASDGWNMSPNEPIVSGEGQGSTRGLEPLKLHVSLVNFYVPSGPGNVPRSGEEKFIQGQLAGIK